MFLTDSMNPTKQELAAQVAAEREAWEAQGGKVQVVEAGKSTYEVKPLSLTSKGIAKKNPAHHKPLEDEDDEA